MNIRGALARGYCTKENEKKVLDATLINAMTIEVEKELAKKLEINKLAEKLFDIDEPNPALMASRFCGHNLWIQVDSTQDKYKAKAQAIKNLILGVDEQL